MNEEMNGRNYHTSSNRLVVTDDCTESSLAIPIIQSPNDGRTSGWVTLSFDPRTCKDKSKFAIQSVKEENDDDDIKFPPPDCDIKEESIDRNSFLIPDPIVRNSNLFEDLDNLEAKLFDPYSVKVESSEFQSGQNNEEYIDSYISDKSPKSQLTDIPGHEESSTKDLEEILKLERQKIFETTIKNCPTLKLKLSNVNRKKKNAPKRQSGKWSKEAAKTSVVANEYGRRKTNIPNYSTSGYECFKLKAKRMSSKCIVHNERPRGRTVEKSDIPTEDSNSGAVDHKLLFSKPSGRTWAKMKDDQNKTKGSNCNVSTSKPLLVFKIAANNPSTSCDKTHSGSISDHGELSIPIHNLTCKECEQRFTSAFLLDHHLRVAHYSNIEMEEPDLFDDFMPRRKKKKVWKPVEPTTTIPIHYCQECKEEFKSALDFTRHVRAVHSLESIKKITKNVSSTPININRRKCPFCKSVYANVKFLKAHIFRKHSQIPNYECTECGVKFSLPSALQNHITLKHKDKPKFPCLFCGRCFPSNQKLSQHHGDRKLVCDYCCKNFGKKSTLGDHCKLHGDIRPFACNYCELKFRCAKTRKEHEIRKHTKEFPFVCHSCDRKFVLLNQCKKHKWRLGCE